MSPSRCYSLLMGTSRKIAHLFYLAYNLVYAFLQLEVVGPGGDPEGGHGDDDHH